MTALLASPRSSLVLGIALVGAVLAAPRPGRAQPAGSLGEPLVVLNVAGVDRVLEDVRWVFESADRPDLVEGVETVLNAVGQLKGLDRTRPLGAMAFAVPTGDRQPLVVGYVPVENLDELMKSLTVGPLRPERVPDAPGRWRIAGPENPENAVLIEARDGYAWIVRDPQHFAVAYPDPVATTRELTERYDLSFSFNVAAIPSGLRFLASAALRNAAPKVDGDANDPRTRLQQRALDAVLAFGDRFLSEGRDVVLGWDVSKSRREVVAEFAVNAQEGSSLAKSFEQFAGAPSRFASLLEGDETLASSISWRMGESTRAFLTDAVGIARARAVEEAADAADGPPAELVGSMFDVFAATVAGGHVDGFVRATGSPPGGLVILGAVGIEKGEKLDAFYEALGRRSEEDLEGRLVRGVATHGGVVLHRIVPRANDAEARRVFGADPALHFGSDANTLWFAFGGRNGLPALQQAIDAAAATPVDRAGGEPGPLVSLDASAATLMLLSDERDPEFEAIAQRAFLAGGDRVGFSLGPKPNGLAVRLRLGEGWVRLVGLAAAKGFDESR